MSVDLATLAIRVQSLETVIAGKRLDGLSAKAVKTTAATQGLSKAAKFLGGALAGLFAAKALAGVFANISRTTAKFEASISDLSAITGAAGKDLEFFEDQAKRMGRTTTLSASQVAEAFKLVASAKPDLLESKEALTEVTEAAIVLAEATGSTLPEAAETLGSSLNQFSAGAEEAERFINVLAAGARFGASMVNETAEALRYAGTVASSVNVTFEQTNAIIQQLSTVAIKGSEAGTAMRNMFLKLEAQVEGRFKPSVVKLIPALKALREENLSNTELVELFGLRSVVAAAQIIRNADAVEILEGKLTGTETAYDQQKIKVDNLEGSYKALNSAQEGLSIRIGEDLNPTIRAIVDVITQVTNAYTSYLGKSEAAVDGTGILSETLRVLMQTLFLFRTAFTAVGETIGWVAAHFVNGAGMITDAIGGLGRYIWAIFEEIGINIQMGANRFIDLGDSIGAFAARVVALLSFDFDLADQIGEAREETAAAADAELDKLAERAKAVSDNRDTILGATADEIAARVAASDAMDADFIARRKKQAQEVGLFFMRTEAGYEAQAVDENGIALTEEQIALNEKKLEQERSLAEFVAQKTAEEDTDRAIGEVADRFATEIEAAEKNAEEQLAILEGITIFTAEQEELKAETIRRINQELFDFKAELADKDKEQKVKETEEALQAEQDKANLLTEFKILAAETEVEAEQIRHEDRMARIIERGEEEGVARTLIDEVIAREKEKHEVKVTAIEEREVRARKKLRDLADKNSLKNTLGAMAQMTSGVAQHSKAMFKVNKALALAQAVVALPSSVMQSFENGGGYPWGLIPAGLMLATGLQQINAIRSSQFEGGGGGTTPSLAGSQGTINGQATGNTVGINASSDDLLNPPQADDGTETRTQIIVTGNVGFTPDVIDEIAGGLREATGDRDIVLFDENSRQAQDIAGAGSGAG